ncbi:hypothetical protein [Paenibacillus wenxiniae]|uniref:Uncharacterized protein n=1 Tax=Paenibacillus wenxiniae TaxID=1636843 RepID=A0ABW4RRH4_9BACL
MIAHDPVCPCCQHALTRQEARALAKASAHDDGFCPACYAELYPTRGSRAIVSCISLVIGLLILTICLWAGGTLAIVGVLIAVAVQLVVNYTLRPFIYSYQAYEEPLFKL